MKSFLSLFSLSIVFASTLFATGALFVRPLNSTANYNLMDMKSYDATIGINDQVALTHVDQLFYNNTSMLVEATYIFPLPVGAVITEMAYWFNGTRYVGGVREKAAAQKAYNDKIRVLIDPALLQELGDNVFKLNIAPINAYSDVRFEITYTELLSYEFGRVNFNFLLKTTGLSPKPLQRVSLYIDIQTRKNIKLFATPSYQDFTANKITKLSDNHYQVQFGDEQYTPTTDYKLYFETVREGLDVNVSTYVPEPRDSCGTDGFFAAWVTPPDSMNEQFAISRAIVFTADVSSSMEGKRMAQLQEALKVFLDNLKSSDQFNIIAFSTNVAPFSQDLVAATPTNVAEARLFIKRLSAVGLTNISGALRESFAQNFSDSFQNSIVFFTDGVPSWGELDSSKIVANAKALNTKGARLFTFGIGDISKYILENLAKDNGGYSAIISSADSIPLLIANHFKRISLPALATPILSYGALDLYDVYPIALPDLFFGNQVLQLGRYRRGGQYPVNLTGTLNGVAFDQERMVDFPATNGGIKAVSRLWAQSKISELLSQIAKYGEKKELVDAIIDLSKRFQILTRYTALYADPDEKVTVVDESSENLLVDVSEPSPNPMADQSLFAISMKGAVGAFVSIDILDLQGNVVRSISQKVLESGVHQFAWDGTDNRHLLVVRGFYLLRVQIGTTNIMRTIILNY